jgi:HTH-type transcriptional regulator/antitoxin HigA
MEVVMVFPLASIKSDEQFREAQEVMDQLLSRGDLDDGEEMYLDALSDLVGAYEDEHYAIEPASDADMLRHLMEAKGVTQAQLSRETTIPKSTISEILGVNIRRTRSWVAKTPCFSQIATGSANVYFLGGRSPSAAR